ncbi:MAG: CIA30 family protein [Alphaproteobacteria bacterium]
MKDFLILLFIFIFVNEINAMDLLNKKNIRSYYEKLEFISDEVMGGKSTGDVKVISSKNENFIRLKGLVSTENNGGFIQFRSNYDFTNNEYKGIKITAKGQVSEYYIHIRTNFLLLPWQYYSGKFEVDDKWKEIRILFSDFKKSNFYQPSEFDSSEIKSIGFVAYGKDFDAELDLLEAELF